MHLGGVAERLNAPVLKTGRPKGLAGSNPAPSAFQFPRISWVPDNGRSGRLTADDSTRWKKVPIFRPMNLTAEQKWRGVIPGWVCLGLGLLVMYWSHWTFLAYVPLFLIALAFSAVAMARDRGLGAVLLLVGTLVAPWVMWIGLGGTDFNPRVQPSGNDRQGSDEKPRSGVANNPPRRPMVTSIRPAVGTKEATLAIDPIPRSAVPDQRAVNDAQRRAFIAYPSLNVTDSPLRREYLDRLKRYRIENKEFFSDAGWPLKLAEECQHSIGGK